MARPALLGRRSEVEDRRPMLRVELIGHMGADAEQRPSARGPMVSSLRVAVNQRRQRPDDQIEETTTWFAVRAMGAVGERAAELARGQRVLVIGRLDIRPYARSDGTPGVAHDVWADEVLSLGPRVEPDGRRPVAAGSSGGTEASDPDDLPF
jgi:single stranded DNA-binding protein